MESQLTTVSLLSILLLIGILVSLISIRIKISDILLLLIAGLLLSQTKFFTFGQEFLTGFAIFALIMILFDSTSRFKLREISQLSAPALKLSLIFLLLNIIFLSLSTNILFFKFSIATLIISMLFGALMSGTSPDVILSILKDKKSKIAEVLEFESIINTPLVVLIPFIMLDFYFGTVQANELIIKFLQGIMTGIGTGFFIGIVVFSLMKKRYEALISPLAVIAAAFISYTMAESIGGNGVLSVTAFGIVFGVMSLKEKGDIQQFSSIFTNFLKIVVFILLGLIIKIPFNLEFILKSLLLFGICLLIRYLAVSLSFRKSGVNKAEKIFMTLNVSKGVAVAVVIFFIGSYSIEGLKTIIDLSLLFILYSIILSSLTVKFSNKFLSYRKNILLKK